MPRKPSYASQHAGKAPPWNVRDVNLVVPQAIAERVRCAAAALRAQGSRRFTIRRYGTVVVWDGGEPIGSFTIAQHLPRAGWALVRRIEWDERRGYTEQQVWQAFEQLAGDGAAAQLEPADTATCAAD
jgi:hypothetical protein